MGISVLEMITWDARFLYTIQNWTKCENSLWESASSHI